MDLLSFVFSTAIAAAIATGLSMVGLVMYVRNLLRDVPVDEPVSFGYHFSSPDVELLYENGFPYWGSEEAAGSDVRSAISATINPGQTLLIPTSLHMDTPAGYEIQARPRSGLAAKHGVTVLNGPGTIDSDYRGEIKIPLYNSSSKPYHVKAGDRVAQLVLNKLVDRPAFSRRRLELFRSTERAEGGFGSTGN